MTTRLSQRLRTGTAAALLVAASAAGPAFPAPATAAVPADQGTTADAAAQQPDPRPVGEALAGMLDTSDAFEAAALAAVRQMSGDFYTSAAPRVTHEDDGSLVIRLTDLTSPIDETSNISAPYLTFRVRKAEEGRVHVIGDLSPNLTMPEMTVRMTPSEMSGVYDPDLDTLVDSRVRITDIEATSSVPGEPGGMTIDSVVANEEIDEAARVIDGRGDIVIDGVRFSEADDGSGFGIGRISGAYTMSGVDRGGFVQIMNIVSLMQQAGDDAVSGETAFRTLADLRWTGFDGSLAFSDIVIQEAAGAELASLNSLRLSVGSANPDGTGTLRVGLAAEDAALSDAGWDSLAKSEPEAVLPPKGVIPRDIGLTATIESFPFADVFRAGTAPTEEAARAQITDAFSRAGSRLNLSDVRLAAPEAALGGDLTLAPQPDDSVTADGTFHLSGIDTLMAAVAGMPQSEDAQQLMAVLFMLKGMGQPDGDALVYRIETSPDGMLMVNGMPLGGPAGGQE